jgi:hypothetical protein
VTQIAVELYTGTGKPAIGRLIWEPTAQSVYNTGYLLPASAPAMFNVTLYDGKALVDVPPSPDGLNPMWVWKVTEQIATAGAQLVNIRYLQVPLSTTVVQYSSLPGMVAAPAPEYDQAWADTAQAAAIDAQAARDIAVAAATSTVTFAGITGGFKIWFAPTPPTTTDGVHDNDWWLQTS